MATRAERQRSDYVPTLSHKTTDPVIRKWLERVDDRFMGTAVQVDPHEAILHAISISAGEVAYCEAQISRLCEDELFERPLNTETFQTPFGEQLTEVTERRDAEVISRWVSLRTGALERMVKYSKIAIDLGISERQVAAAERVAQALTPLLQSLVTDLQLTPEQQQLLPAVIGARLKELETTTQEGRDEYE